MGSPKLQTSELVLALITPCLWWAYGEPFPGVHWDAWTRVLPVKCGSLLLSVYIADEKFLIVCSVPLLLVRLLICPRKGSIMKATLIQLMSGVWDSLYWSVEPVYSHTMQTRDLSISCCKYVSSSCLFFHILLISRRYEFVLSSVFPCEGVSLPVCFCSHFWVMRLINIDYNLE